MHRRLAHLLLVLSATTQLTLADDWPNWHGPRHDGVSEEADWDPAKIDQVAWTAEVGIGFASVAVSGGRLYTLGHNGDKGAAGEETIYCLDAKTGKEIWSTSYAARLLPNLHEGGPASTPTVDGSMLYTLSKDGRLLCSDAGTGKRRWQRQLLEESEMDEPAEWGFASSPLIMGERVIVEAAHTLAFDKSNGAPAWKSERYQPAYGTPAPFTAGGKDFLATIKNDGLVILGAADGKTHAFEEWKTRFSTNANTPIVRGDQLFISTGYGRGCALYKFSDDSLEPVYTSKNMSNHMSNCVLVGDHLYGFDGNTHTGHTRVLKCLEFSTGDERWSQPGLGIGALCAAGDRLIILSEKGELIIAGANPEKFAPIQRAQASSGRHWNVPVISNGFIYVRNAAGRLTAIDVNPD
ncbi:MAG: PQQ-binding-like beta-propeller repeat protein [Verrucomicrobiales bacterium]